MKTLKPSRLRGTAPIVAGTISQSEGDRAARLAASFSLAKIGKIWLISIAVIVAQSVPSLAQLGGRESIVGRGICALSEQDLIARYVASARLPSGRSTSDIPRMARWKEREASIGVFQDKSARLPASALDRNFAIFNGIGQLGFGRLFRLGMSFKDPKVDIQLEFVSRKIREEMFRRLPVGVPASAETDRCRVYIWTDGSDAPIQSISQAHIVVDDELDIADLPTCISDALIRATGLIGWPVRDDYRSMFEKYAEARLFVDALYSLPEAPTLDAVRGQLIEMRSTACR